RLSECISILPAVTESCPKENMAAFCVETNDKTHVFAAEKHVTTDWVEKMCEIAFQVRECVCVCVCVCVCGGGHTRGGARPPPRGTSHPIGCRGCVREPFR